MNGLFEVMHVRLVPGASRRCRTRPPTASRRGERNVSLLDVRAIAVALRVPLVELFPDTQGQHTTSG